MVDRPSSKSQVAGPTSRTESWQWPPEILVHRDFLCRLAQVQLGSAAEADDVVQDTLIAAASQLGQYAERASLKAWLTGILRHKITDVLRLRMRFVPLDFEDDSASIDAAQQFTADGRWHPETFIDRSCPQTQAHHHQLLDLVELCLNALPEATAQIFLMREYLGLETEEILAKTQLAPGNLRVILHRARLRLRECVVRGWGEWE